MRFGSGMGIGETSSTMKTLKNLFIEADFAAVWDALRARYPKTVGDANMADYLAVFDELRARAEAESEYTVRVRRFIDEVDGEIIDVDGIIPGVDGAYSLAALPWAAWLGSPFRVEGEITDAEAAAYCLYEITFLSFDEIFCGLEVEAAVDAINQVDADDLPPIDS